MFYAPKPIYANGWMLRAALPTYFEQCESVLSDLSQPAGYQLMPQITVLSDKFGDCTIDDLGGQFPKSHAITMSDYDYDSDSDFEDDEEDSATGQLSPEGTGDSATSSGVNVDTKASPSLTSFSTTRKSYLT